ncbi:MAG: hypothetical protein KGZ96_00535 [Clostridia bacterium]|nr:hypothetical protein [Clostridia bacterium]
MILRIMARIDNVKGFRKWLASWKDVAQLDIKSLKKEIDLYANRSDA